MRFTYNKRTFALYLTAAVLATASLCLNANASQADGQQQQIKPSEPQLAKSTQPTIERQLDAPAQPAASVSSVQQPPVVAKSEAPAAPLAPKPEQPAKPADSAAAAAKPTKPKQTVASLKKSSLASQQNYDKYQLKATNSYNSVASSATTAAASGSSVSPAPSEANKQSDQKSGQNSKDSPNDSLLSASVANKKAAQQQKQKQSSFSLLRKFLPSFMTSAAGPMAAAAAAAASAVADKHQHGSGSGHQHSRSSSSSSTGGLLSEGILSKASGKFIQMISSGANNGGLANARKTGSGSDIGAVPNHAPFFIRKASGPIDRQGGFASSLLSNPLSLGLLFSAPLIPSLLLTPLAIAGLSPAMSAINNFFGDDDELASTPASSGPLASLLSGSAPGLSNFLSQAAGGGANLAQASGSSGESSSASSPSFALQAMQSLLGPTSTTERPLFNPGLFASQGIQNAAANLATAAAGSMSGSGSSSGSSSTSGGLSSPSNSPMRGLFGGSGGGSLMQAAASMISPSFAAPPSSASSSSSSSSGNSDDDGPGFMQVASDVFDKVASFMGTQENTPKDLAQASSSPSGSLASSGSQNQMSPISTLVGLSNFSPFQLSSLLASSPLAQAFGGSQASGASTGSSASSGGPPAVQKAGFFSTLRNVYELFSSSFLRRNQEVGSDPDECQQRLICELHQRAMNSKLFRRSLNTNLMELANIDRSLQEQMKSMQQQQQQQPGVSSNSPQARVDSETKQMLNDFLKATNNFRAGRELVNCSKMYPKCSRVKLLAAANAHLADPINGKAIGKFSNLMKKMKFKSAQQHQSQWKLRKANKSSQLAGSAPLAPVRLAGGVASPQQQQQQPQYQASDYLQVAPLSPNMKPTGSQLTPADSLKLVQQIMLMSQQSQQQAAQMQPVQQVAGNQYASGMQMQASQMSPQYRQPQQLANQMQMQMQPQQQPQPQQQAQQIATYQQQNYGSYQPAPVQTTYTDAIVPQQQQQQQQVGMYSSGGLATESPYYFSPQISGSGVNQMSGEMSPQVMQNTYQQQQQQTATSLMPALGQQEQVGQQQQQQQVDSGKSGIRPQQPVAGSKPVASAA